MGIFENRDAQFMLLAGFIIAIGLVITTVMLNSVIFEINMATEASNEFSKSEITNLIFVVKDETRSAYSIANASGGSKTQKMSNFSDQTQNFSANMQKIYALHGVGVNISLDLSNWNAERYASFTENGSANGVSNWIVMEGVKNSTIKLNIIEITSPFNINITNATKTWQINFTSQGNYTINNTQIKQNITSAYAISFMNGSGTAGNYSIIGNTTYDRDFIRAREYILNATITLSSTGMNTDITVPIPVPW